ncbi:hypothetical protein LIER_20391 [Lithospermum erythrorhizon]|uniref:Uncharacterized protein n=1 Tax=Lithospermum erythrorhizon TaxID=34254 RepID=A0AAV3QS02_LITER
MAKTCKTTQGSFTISFATLIMLFLVLILNSNNVQGRTFLDAEEVFKKSKPESYNSENSFSTTLPPASSFSNHNSKREFQAAAHRVPSGPNPESN